MPETSTRFRVFASYPLQASHLPCDPTQFSLKNTREISLCESKMSIYTRVREEVRSSILDPLIGPNTHSLAHFMAILSQFTLLSDTLSTYQEEQRSLKNCFGTLMSYVGKCDLYYKSD